MYWRQIAADPKVWRYLALLFWPALLCGRAALPYVLAAVPAALVNIIGGTYLIEMYYHYDHSTFAMVLCAVLLALSRLKRPALISALLVSMSLGLQFGLPQQFRTPGADIFKSIWKLEKIEDTRVAENLAAVLPRDLVLSVDYTTINYLLAGRKEIYMWENPFERASFGIYDMCEEFKSPPQVDLVILRHDYKVKPELQQMLDEYYEKIAIVSDKFNVYVNPRSKRIGEIKAALRTS